MKQTKKKPSQREKYILSVQLMAVIYGIRISRLSFIILSTQKPGMICDDNDVKFIFLCQHSHHPPSPLKKTHTLKHTTRKNKESFLHVDLFHS